MESGDAQFYTRYSGATQRARILDAITRVVAEKGYAGATVADIVAEAGVSRSSFYELFDGKAQCLVEAYRTATTIAIEKVATATAGALDSGWRIAAETAVHAYFEVVRESPQTSRMVFLDFRSLGAASIEENAQAQSRYVASVLKLQRSLAKLGTSVPTRPEAELGLIFAGIETRVAQALASGDMRALNAVEAAAKTLLVGSDR
ncbi:MAG TPA: helix-turn-helix domain-containing protein [Marmoricola sp.]|nr:helix-turn-helix domain-containing protein [Marmoricola sp.]